MIRSPLRKRGWHATRPDPLLTLWGQAIKARDRGICRRCGRRAEGRGMHAAHIFSRGKPATRYDLSNGLTLCASCHKWAHAETSAFQAWAAERIGAEAYQRLLVRSNLSGQKNDPVVVKADLTAWLKELQKRANACSCGETYFGQVRMTPEARQQIREREAEATAGPWWAVDNGERPVPMYVIQHKDGEETYAISPRVYYHKDAEFIAHAREDIPALLTALDATEKELLEEAQMHDQIVRAEVRRGDRLAAEVARLQQERDEAVKLLGALVHRRQLFEHFVPSDEKECVFCEAGASCDSKIHHASDCPVGLSEVLIRGEARTP